MKHAVAEAGHWRAAAEAARTAAQEQVSKHDMELIRLHEGGLLLVVAPQAAYALWRATLSKSVQSAMPCNYKQWALRQTSVRYVLH